MAAREKGQLCGGKKRLTKKKTTRKKLQGKVKCDIYHLPIIIILQQAFS